MSNSEEFDNILKSNKTKFINEEQRSTLPTITTTDSTKKQRRKPPSPIKIINDDKDRDSHQQNNMSLERVGIPTSPAFNTAWYSPPAIVESNDDQTLTSTTSVPSPLPSPRIPSPLPSPRISSLAFARESRDKDRPNTPNSTISTITPKLSNINVNSDDSRSQNVQQSPSIRLIEDSGLPPLPPLPPSPESPESPQSPQSRSTSSDIGFKCFNQDESFLPKQKHAEWLGSHGPSNKEALMTYMSQFDFSGLRLDDALRKLTSKLFLRAESQQIDRILESFSNKFFNDNPTSLYRSPDVVHAISYSILLLNTDLHIADIVTHMSRNQFLKNTLNVVHNQYNSKADSADDSSSIASSKTDNTNKAQKQQQHQQQPQYIPQGPPLSYYSRRNKLARNGSLSSMRSNLSPSYSASASPSTSSLVDDRVKKSASSITINQNYEHHQLDSDLEPLLREIYNSIRSQKILLPLDSSTAGNLSASNSRQRLPRNLSSASMSASSLKRGSIRGLSSLLGNDGRVSPTPSLGSVMEVSC